MGLVVDLMDVAMRFAGQELDSGIEQERTGR